MTLDFHFRTISKQLTKENFFAFLEKCNGKYIKAAKFNYFEPCKNIFDPANPGEVYDMFNDYGNFILKGKDGFWISVNDTREGIITWSGGIRIKNLKKKDEVISEIIAVANSLSANGQLLSGYIATEEEHRLKHEVITSFSSGGRSIGWNGSSNSDFQKRFPGIYWATFFGKAMYSHIGKEKFLNILDADYLNMADDTIGFTLQLPIDDEYNEEKKKAQRQIANHIGKEYFFDKEENSDASYPDSLVDFLKSLEKQY